MFSEFLKTERCHASLRDRESGSGKFVLVGAQIIVDQVKKFCPMHVIRRLGVTGSQRESNGESEDPFIRMDRASVVRRRKSATAIFRAPDSIPV